ncbi:putative nuclease HARBI1 isoform X2 [Ixodes scapularis]|uniref:putative nuclease HARBI1 isoform X2 n=1 Tax=Ixodes scapularis TaxID=6945 RepID=UPI001A9DC19E|nr:putative nuclease HARBI1 isoform X2 [Ixodes scapularis]
MSTVTRRRHRRERVFAQYAVVMMGRQRVFRDRLNPLEEFDEDELQERFRFGRAGIVFLADTLRPDLERPTRRSRALSAEQQVIVALQFYATGNFLITAGDYIRVHVSTASRTVRRVTQALARRARDFIGWPGEAEGHALQQAFFEIGKLADGVYEGLLLGDSGYTCKPWLMTPFLSPSSAAEVAYNASHSTTRSIVERTIGQLKRRFHCLHAELRMQPERCCDITVACCVLHNLAKTYPCSMPRTVLPEEVPVEPVAAGRDESNEARDAIVSQFFG